MRAVLKKVLSRGGEYADIFVEQRKVTFLQLEDDRIEKLVSGVDRGVGIRLISGGKTAYGFGNDLSEGALMELAATLSGAFDGTAADLTLDLRRLEPVIGFTIAKRPEDTSSEWKIRLLEAANHAARSSDPRIKQVTGTYRDSGQKVLIVNSEGVIAEDERIHTLAAVHVVASDGNMVQTGYEAVGGHSGLELFDASPLEQTALKASGRALMMLTARRAPGGRMPIIISSEAGGTMIHEAIGHGLEADLAQQGLSVYSRKIGAEVASEIVTVIDDSTLPGKRGSFRFDDEGVPSQRTVLVDRGKLAGYMYDRLTAVRDGVASTGNGRRESYRHRPIPRMTNTFIAPGDSPPEDIIKATPEGLFVKKMGGGQVNTVGGDFVFDVQEGYMIRNGAICEPVRGATLSGSGPSVLKSIDMVASDLGFSIGTCGKDSQGVPVSDAMPTVRIREMVVGGEVNL
jgi:TldD protein